MKLELHMIQNFPPACLNRDDTNTPKDCQFAGYRRARISSQCIKRAIRKAFSDDGLLPRENLGWRTKRLVEEVGKRLAGQGRDEGLARRAAQIALGGFGFRTDDETGQTQYLLFLGESGVQALTDLCRECWDSLEQAATKLSKAEAAEAEGDKGAKKAAKDAKKAAKEAVPHDVKEGLDAVLDGTKAADLALFGRMLADLPGKNIDAACQVAHAISTHKVDMEMDFYTAVDDLKTTEEDAGAGMMGVIGYNASCFYRYAVLDWDQLLDNLGGDVDLARRTVEAFLRASALAVPTGKQNTFAAHSRPDFILAMVRESGAPLSLANAFANPARPRGERDLTQVSVDQLADYWAKVTGVYGTGGTTHGPWHCGPTQPTSGDGAPQTGWQAAGTLDALVENGLAHLPERAES